MGWGRTTRQTPHKNEALDSEDLEQREGPEKGEATREEYEFQKDWKEAEGTGQGAPVQPKEKEKPSVW